MNRRSNRKLRNLALLLIVPSLLAFAACEEEEGPTGPAEDGAVSLAYLGYSDMENRNPRCGRCHQEKTFGWRETKHANALTTLQESSGYEDSCRLCHTTGWNPDDGIYGADNAWQEAGNDTLMYRDVQCEVCHGPASQHNNPYISDPTDVLMAENPELWYAQLCGTCHQDSHFPYYEEWQESAHARSNLSAGGIVATNESCTECHIAQSFENWLRTGESGFVAEHPQPITCQTCHTAHSNENPGQLRLPLGQNIICAKCHNAEGVLPGETVHHATWEVFSGSLAFTYPDSTYDNSGHYLLLGEQTGGEACVACHVFNTPYVDAENPAKTGHTFKPRLVACHQCHPNATDFNINGVQTEIQGLIDQLQSSIDAAGPNVKTTDSYKNALYILQAMKSEGSYGVHNTKYTRGLLQDAIDDFASNGHSSADQKGGRS